MIIERHGLNYTPRIPHPKIVRIRGVVNKTTLDIFWRQWVIGFDKEDAHTVGTFLTFLLLFVFLILGLICL